MTDDLPDEVRDAAGSWAGVIASLYRDDDAGSRTLLESMTGMPGHGLGFYRLCEHLLRELAAEHDVPLGSAACWVAGNVEAARQAREEVTASHWPDGAYLNAQRAAALLACANENGGQRQLGVEFGTPWEAMLAHVVLAMSLVEDLADARNETIADTIQAAALHFA